MLILPTGKHKQGWYTFTPPFLTKTVHFQYAVSTILKRSEDWSIHLGLGYLIDCIKSVSDFDINSIEPANEDDLFFKRHALKYLDQYFIHSEQELFDLTLECLDFIKRYDRLYTQILSDNPEKQGKAETRAYIFNQDRLHLFMPYSIAGPIDDEKDNLSPEQINNVIQATILSNKRSLLHKLDGLYLSNMEVFHEGYFATLHNDQYQHKLSLNFYKSMVGYSLSDRFEVIVNGQEHHCQAREDDKVISVQSPFFDNLNLLEEQYKQIAFYRNGEIILLRNFVFSFTEAYNSDNFAQFIA